ncbi:MAG TPA: DUF6089 family protein [Salinimicrobium sp.]|nr:DUF6089 family protein [Salinimicrobium sp.]
MRYIIAVVFIFPLFAKSYSQTYEIGAVVGGSNYIGDVGSTTYIDPSSLAFGGIFKWNRSNRHSFRFSIMYLEVEANDADSEDLRRRQRNYSFENKILETSLGLEYTFWEFDLHTGKPQFTPYLFTGINYTKSNHLLLNSQNEFEEEGANWEFAIPMVVGIKTTLTQKIIAGFEVGARYTFTDNIDGSDPSEIEDSYELATFGNENTSDWYVFTGITLTFTFGRKPCFCSF